MTFINITPDIPDPPVPLSTTYADRSASTNTTHTNPAIAARLDEPRLGEFKREMLTWRTPNLGYVQMYINPQQLKITDKKIISNARTKGGYIIQYSGEELTRISINGTTGSGGIEGINILRSIYRSEHEAFEGIATALEEALTQTQFNAMSASLLAQSPLSQINVFQVVNDVFRNFGRPQPTLASLATSVELFFQGELYKGYFESFSVSESAEHPGIFEYSMEFLAYARQGVRRNFMPWHRQPVYPADYNINPLSFTEARDVITQDLPRAIDVLRDTRLVGSQVDQRDTGTSANAQGGNLSGQSL